MAKSNEVEIIVTSQDKTKAGFDSATSRSSKLGSAMQKAGDTAGKILAVGLAGAGIAAYKMTQAAAEDEAAQAKLATALRNNAGATDDQIAATEEWISAQGEALGVADDELRPALAKLVGVTKDVGEAQKLASLGMDIAAGSGKSLDSVTQSLAKAMATGSTAALSKYGIETKKANGETISMDQAVKRLSDTFGGQAAKAAETQAGQAKKLAVQWGELQEEIGAKLLPVMQKLVSIGMKVVDWIGHNQTTVGVLIATLGTLLAVTWAVGKAIQFWSTITKIATGIQAAFNLVLAMNPIGLIIIAIVALGVALVVAYKKSETFRNFVNGLWDLLKRVGGWIKDNWKTIILVALTGPFGLAVVIIKKNWSRIKGVFSDAWNKVKEITSNAWNKLKDLISNAWNKIKELQIRAILWVKDKIRDGWEAAKDLTVRVWNAIKDKIADVWNGIKDRVRSAVSSVKDLIANAFSSARDKVGDILSGLKDRVTSIFGNVLDYIRGIPGKIRDIFSNIWSGITGGLRDAVNAALGLPLEFPGWDWPGPGGIGPKTLIPALARGGIATRPTLAVVGDGPTDEAIIPLDGRHGMGGSQVTLVIEANDSEVSQFLATMLRKYVRVRGGDVQGVLGR